jgi:hypothetical protein
MTMRDADPSAAVFKGSFVSGAVAAFSAAAVIFFGCMPGTLITLLKGIPLIH